MKVIKEFYCKNNFPCFTFNESLFFPQFPLFYFRSIPLPDTLDNIKIKGNINATYNISNSVELKHYYDHDNMLDL